MVTVPVHKRNRIDTIHVHVQRKRIRRTDLKEGYYLIGEVSKITGISKDTLHFYNKIGLLVPDYIDEKNQYRYYSRWKICGSLTS